MKKIILVLVFCVVTYIVKSQTASVEKSIFGIQTGIFGVWIQNESKLSNQFALRIELGLDVGVYGNDADDINGLLLAPTITLEPRWYYNLNKRESKSKRIDRNSGNFILIKTTYHPDWFVISNENNINFTSDISIIPTWGIRRTIGQDFNYEAGAGIGYVHYLENDTNSLTETGVIVNLHLRIGYQF